MIKGLVVDIDNRFNKVFPSFDILNPEFTSRYTIIDSFSSCFSFHFFNKHNDDSLLFYSYQLDKLAIISSDNPSYVLIITDTSIKNNVATSIAHIYIHNKFIIKTLHHTVNINSIEAKLFTIRCSINQTTNSTRILKIVIVTNSIHTAKKYLIHYCICFKFMLYLSFVNFKSSLYFIRKTQLNSGSVLIDATGHFIKWLTKK